MQFPFDGFLHFTYSLVSHFSSTFLVVVCWINGFTALTTYPVDEEYVKLRNQTETLSRHRRFLVFPNGGNARFGAGYLIPTDIPLYQNINVLNNLNWFYPVPPNWVWKSNVWPGLYQGRSMNNGNETQKQSPIPDSSRKIAYEIIESILNKEGRNGHECMLRAICEVAETPVNHNGIIGELMQIFFTPGDFEPLDSDYRIARKAGFHHVNCEKLYPDCPIGHGILDSISLIREFKLQSFLKF